MQVADVALGPVVWGVPRGSIGMTEIRRKLYCHWHAPKLRMFFLGMLAADCQMSPKNKAAYYSWLQEVPWARFLAGVSDVSYWTKNVDNPCDPVNATLKREYDRLYSCFQSGHDPNSFGVI